MPSRALRIPATDGFALAATLHEPERAPRAAVLVNGATAVPRRFYRAFADFLAERGFVALTYDYRGMGDSRPGPPDARMIHWGERDMAGALAFVAKEHGALPLALVGHSAGGQLVCVADGADRARALVGVAAQSGHWRHWPAPARWRRMIDWHVLMPSVAKMAGHVPGWMGLSEDLPRGIALEWARWCRHPDYILRDDTARRRAGFAKMRAPFLSWSFEDDAFGPKAAADWLAAQYVNADVERRHETPTALGLPSVGHMGFFRRGSRAALWEPTADWLDRKLA